MSNILHLLLFLPYTFLFHFIFSFEQYEVPITSLKETSMVRIASISNTLYLFYSTECYTIQFNSHTHSSLHSKCSNIFNITQTASSVVNLPNNNTAIAGTANNKLIQVDNEFNIINTISFYDLLPSSQSVSFDIMDTNNVIISHIGMNHHGKIIIYDIHQQSFNEIQTYEKWNSVSFINFDCKFSYLFNNILCVFSPNDYNVYFGMYSIYGQYANSKVLVHSESIAPIVNVRFVFLNDAVNDNNIYDEVVVCYTDSLNVYLLTVRYTLDISKHYAYTILYNVTVDLPSTPIIEVNSLTKISRDMFVIVLGDSTFMFYTKELQYLGKVEYNKILYCFFIVITPIPQHSDEFLLSYLSNRNNTKIINVRYSISKCNNLMYNVSLYDSIDIDVSELIKGEYIESSNSHLKVMYLTQPALGLVMFGKESTSGSNNNRLEYFEPDVNTMYDGVKVLYYMTGDYIGEFYIEYYINELINEDLNIYVPSSKCRIDFNVQKTFNDFIICDENKSIKVDNKTCIAIADHLVLTLDEYEKYYYSGYIDLSQNEFQLYYPHIQRILRNFISNNNNNNNKRSNHSITNNDTIIAINTQSFSYYYLPLQSTSNIFIRNASMIHFENDCIKSLITTTTMNNNDNKIYVAIYDLYNSNINTSLPNNIEYEFYIENGDIIDISKYCSYVNITHSFWNINSFINLFELHSDLQLQDEQVDLLDPNDKFYNDICYLFNSPNDKDTTVKIRRDIYFPEIALCERNCTYININSKTNTIKCNCPIKHEVNLTRDIYYTTTSPFIHHNNSISIYKILSCAKLFFSDLFTYDNTGFYILIILTVINIALITYYFLITISKIKKQIIKKSHFKKPLNISKFSITPHKPSNISSLKQSQVTDKSTIINDINYFKYFSKFKGFKPLSSQSSTNNSIISVFRSSAQLNDFHSAISSSSSAITPSNDIITLPNNNKQQQQQTMGNIYLHKFWRTLQIHNIIISIFYNKSKFNRINFKYLYLITYTSFTFTINALLYTHKYFEMNYYTNTSVNSLKYIINNHTSRSLISAVVVFVIMKLLFYLIFAYKKVECVSKRITAKDVLTTQMKKANMKVIIFYALSFACNVFGFYFCSLFCIIYNHTQTNWILSCIISFVFGCVLSVVMCLLIAVVALVGKVLDNKICKLIVNVINYKF